VSDWPHSLLLDELWLRSRRELVRALEGSGFWPGGVGHWRDVRSLVDLGRQIDQRFLRNALSPAEYGYLHSERAFAAAPNGYASRMPLVLSFGHEVTRLLACCAGSDTDARANAISRADLGAGFNLGISLLDLVIDVPAFSPTAKTVIAALTQADVAQLLKVEHCAAFEDDLVRIPLGDARLLLRIAGRFYAGVIELNAPDAALDELSGLLKAAYRAELGSAQARPTGPSLNLGCEPDNDNENDKSVLPFQVLACLSRSGCAVSSDSGWYESHRRLATHLGRAVAMLDDVCDLVDDLRSQALNSLAARAHGPRLRSLPDDDGAALDEDGDDQSSLDADAAIGAVEDLLASDRLTSAAAQVVHELREVEHLSTSMVGAERANALHQHLATLRTFVRNWLE
jgi:hypothetical protein